MKSIDFTFENLLSLGLTEEILKNNFVDWLLNNEEFYFDVENELIYVGKRGLKKDLHFSMTLLTQNLKDEGKSSEEINKYFEDIRNELKPNLNKRLSLLPEENKREFILKSLTNLNKKIKKAQTKLLKNEMSSILSTSTDIENISKSKSGANPYPRIFKSDSALNKFKNLLAEFGNGNQNLANFSFVFHRMKKDELIFNDLKQIEFIDFLSAFEIHIDRLKPFSQLGNNDLRESIYNRI